MGILVLGLILFLGAHTISIVAPVWRERTAARTGNAWRALYSLVSTVGFALIILGYGAARRHPHLLYAPPPGSHYVAAALMLPVFTLLLAAYLPGRIKAALQHPMLIAVMLWSLAHLIAKGTLASVVLFGAFLIWALADRISFNWRTPRPIAAAPPGRWNDAIALVMGLVLYFIFLDWLHLRWIGVAPFAT
ncbi:MAG: NnrU family protein [Proteobacteria bacterium]|nr:NnrU family protein [Pseudomonadota bacterium]